MVPSPESMARFVAARQLAVRAKFQVVRVECLEVIGYTSPHNGSAITKNLRGLAAKFLRDRGRSLVERKVDLWPIMREQIDDVVASGGRVSHQGVKDRHPRDKGPVPCAR